MDDQTPLVSPSANAYILHVPLLTTTSNIGVLPNFVAFQFSRMRSPPYIFPTVSRPLPISVTMTSDDIYGSRLCSTTCKMGMGTFSRGNEQVDLLLALVRPHLDDGRPELEVGLVHLLRRPHLDVEVLPDEREERSREVHHALVVDRLVHADELLEGEAVGALGAESQRRVHVFQHVVHLGVINSPPEVERQ